MYHLQHFRIGRTSSCREASRHLLAGEMRHETQKCGCKKCLGALEALKKIYDDAKNTITARISYKRRKKIRHNLYRRVKRIIDIYSPLHNLKRFMGKLGRALPNLFKFVLDPAIPPTNNPAERALREIVVHRKIRGGIRSEKSMETLGNLFSCVMTCRNAGLNYLEEMANTSRDVKITLTLTLYLIFHLLDTLCVARIVPSFFGRNLTLVYETLVSLDSFLRKVLLQVALNHTCQATMLVDLKPRLALEPVLFCDVVPPFVDVSSCWVRDTDIPDLHAAGLLGFEHQFYLSWYRADAIALV